MEISIVHICFKYILQTWSFVLRNEYKQSCQTMCLLERLYVPYRISALLQLLLDLTVYNRILVASI